MSIVALKRKANAKYSSHSSNSPLGFSLNGTVRNHQGRVGQTSMMSRTAGPKSKSPNYVPEGIQNNCCHSDNNAIARSVTNTRGMIANKYRWKKQTGALPWQQQNIYNRWVQPDSNHGDDGKGDQEHHIRNVKMLAMNQNKAMSSNGINPETGEPHVVNCQNTVCSRRNGGTRIGGKLIPKAIYTKNTGDIKGSSDMHGGKTGGVISSSEHNFTAKYNRSNLFPIRSQKVFPFRVGVNRKCAVNYQTVQEAANSSYYNTGVTGSDRPGC